MVCSMPNCGVRDPDLTDGRCATDILGFEYRIVTYMASGR